MLRPSNRPVLAYFDAIKNLRLRQLALILKAGYDPNLMVNARGQNGLQYMINYFGATDAHFRLQAPINMAAYLSIAKLLLDSGLDANAIDLLSGETAIYDAIRFNDKDMVALLLNYVDFSLRNKNGETALMCCARFGSKQVMRMILEHLHNLGMDGYFIRQRNRFGLTTLELARAENLDCAKVLTKHLIAYGHHPGAVLTRSSSHHQLLPGALPYHMRAPGPSARAPAAAAALLNDSASDYDSDVLMGNPYHAPVMRPSVSRHHKATVAAGPSAAYYDPKAVEFNQYLLEQQEQEQQGVGAVSSDDDADYFGAGSSGTGLTRSRSCMLGPSGKRGEPKYSASGSGSGHQKKATSSGTSGEPTGGKAAASWDPSGSGRDTMG